MCTPLQVDRIVVEWGGYLDAMAREYVTDVAKLEGTDPAPALAALEAAKAGVGADGKQGKWLDKEKQEQLVRGGSLLALPLPTTGIRARLHLVLTV